MANIVYKPITPYTKQNDTAITKYNFLDWLTCYGNIIPINGAVGSSTTSTIYTVPEGYVLFIIDSNLSSQANSGGGGGADLAVGNYFYIHQSYLNASTSANTSKSHYPMIRVNSSEIIVLRAFVNTSATAHLTGFLVDSALLPNLV